jgi:hypothetical protein
MLIEGVGDRGIDADRFSDKPDDSFEDFLERQCLSQDFGDLGQDLIGVGGDGLTGGGIYARFLTESHQTAPTDSYADNPVGNPSKQCGMCDLFAL